MSAAGDVEITAARRHRRGRAHRRRRHQAVAMPGDPQAGYRQLRQAPFANRFAPAARGLAAAPAARARRAHTDSLSRCAVRRAHVPNRSYPGPGTAPACRDNPAPGPCRTARTRQVPPHAASPARARNAASPRSGPGRHLRRYRSGMQREQAAQRPAQPRCGRRAREDFGGAGLQGQRCLRHRGCGRGPAGRAGAIGNDRTGDPPAARTRRHAIPSHAPAPAVGPRPRPRYATPSTQAAPRTRCMASRERASASTSASTSAAMCRADRVTRRRALPSGTVGGRIAVTR